jgi:AraC-like DNA-binding protein
MLSVLDSIVNRGSLHRNNLEAKRKITWLFATNFSVYLSEKTKLNYTYLSNVFRTENNMTIQQFIITHKIERIKELLLYGELNLSEISYKMHYSSIAHLSNQFKKITGLSPSKYRLLDVIHRIPLEDIGKALTKPIIQRSIA